MKPEPGVKIHDTITRLEYKEDNGDFLKVKARMCVRGDQQIAGVSFKETDLLAPVLKAAEARLLLALAAANGDKVIRPIQSKHSCMVTWEMTWSMYDPPTGGQSLFQRDTSCS